MYLLTIVLIKHQNIQSHFRKLLKFYSNNKVHEQQQQFEKVVQIVVGATCKVDVVFADVINMFPTSKARGPQLTV